MVPGKFKIGLIIIIFLTGLPCLVRAQETEKIRVYRVQFAASKTFIEPSYFKDKFQLEDDIQYFEKDGWYKYFVGDFDTREEAIEYYHATNDVGYVISMIIDRPAAVRKDTTEDIIPADSVAVDEKPDSTGMDLPLGLDTEDKEAEPERRGLTGWQIFFIGLLIFALAVFVSWFVSARNRKKDVISMTEGHEVEFDGGYLSGDEPFAFLDDPGKDLSSWDQLKILEEIRAKNLEIPEFSFWLNSDNISVLGFCLRMIRSFGQQSAYHGVSRLLEHKNDEIRAEAIVTLGVLGNKEILEVFREKFESEGLTNRMLILRAMAKLPDDSSIDFLKELLKTSGNLKIEASYALAAINSVGIKGVQEALEDLGQDSERIARHILINKL